MSKSAKTTIAVKGNQVTVISQNEADYISLTDIARYGDAERTDYIIQNWLRNRNTIEFPGIWESLNNPGFKPIEFDGFKKTGRAQQFYPHRKAMDRKDRGHRTGLQAGTLRTI